MSGYFQKNIRKGSMIVVISANDDTGLFTARLYINNGETASAHKPLKSTTLKGAMKAADKLFAKHS